MQLKEMATMKSTMSVATNKNSAIGNDVVRHESTGQDEGPSLRFDSKGELVLPQRFTKNGRKRAIPFPLKLMKVLSNQKYASIITWLPSGKSFVIIRPKTFVAEILPVYFKSAQYASFTRKLHRWGFTRPNDGTGEFYHKEFQRGRLDLAEQMVAADAVIKTPKSKIALRSAARKAPKPSCLPTTADSSTTPQSPAMATRVPAKSMPSARIATPSPPTSPRRIIQENISMACAGGFTPPLCHPPALLNAMNAERFHVKRRLQEEVEAMSRQKLAASWMYRQRQRQEHSSKLAIAQTILNLEQQIDTWQKIALRTQMPPPPLMVEPSLAVIGPGGTYSPPKLVRRANIQGARTA